ncbi:hypothetical protein ES288_D11G127500v1 [Gossypium darwinii]|uniref:DUF4228 domain-containing protein n=1 Tax=Gossypium darwinii TaxID=34276 RepID=A0A5D2ANP0_GOSDA|nr:hypothetical protein ES288_D11G127500v1 [Gossypium darwinii]
MGNYTSTCFIQDASLNKFAKVIDAQGNLRIVKLPANAADFLLEEPGYIISPVEELKRSRRPVAMRADDELLVGKVYVLVPIGRIHRKVADADMAIIAVACRRKKKTNGAKVLPEDREVEECMKGVPIPPPAYPFGNYRPWIPVLEPIPELL